MYPFMPYSIASIEIPLRNCLQKNSLEFRYKMFKKIFLTYSADQNALNFRIAVLEKRIGQQKIVKMT